MERRLQKIKKSGLLVIFLLIFATTAIYAQQPNQRNSLRIQIWSELDEFPGKFTDENYNENSSDDGKIEDKLDEKKSDNLNTTKENPTSSGDMKQEKSAEQNFRRTSRDRFVNSAEPKDMYIFDFAIKRAKEISPYLLGGMLSGWEFDYVPYDKTRRVSEFFELTEIEPFNPQVNKIHYKEPQPMEDRLVCWVECERTDVQKLAYQRWMSITHPRITGHGTAPVENGFEGIKAACSAAVKDAVREYWRTLVKNKPKEILGKVLLIQDPRIYIYEGQYVVDLDFFIQTDKIVSYSYY